MLIRPLMLQGVRGISVGRGTLIRDEAWLGTEYGGTLDIGSRCYIGHRVHMHAIDPVVLGDDCVLADNVFIASADHARDDRHTVHGTGPITIGSRVFIGQNVVILGGVTIGDGATIGAGAVVTKDVPAGATALGVPAKVRA